MNDFSYRQYDPDQVDRIIRYALKLKAKDTLQHEDLMDLIHEIGLEKGAVEAAIQKVDVEIRKEAAFRKRSKQRNLALKRQLSLFLVVNSILLAIDVSTPGTWWFQWPALGMGLSLVHRWLRSHPFHLSKVAVGNSCG